MSCGLLNPWIHLTETFWELYLVISAEELPNRDRFGISSVIFFVCSGLLLDLCPEIPSRSEGGSHVEMSGGLLSSSPQ